MYIVIFEAQIKQLDEAYYQFAQKLRKLAEQEYGCTQFTALQENNTELAFSYWPSRDHIRRWAENPLHQKAMHMAKSSWYSSFKVTITKIENERHPKGI